MAPRLRFPVSDHSDGQRFFNPRGQRPAAAFSALIKWGYQRLILRQKINWPKALRPNREALVPPAKLKRKNRCYLYRAFYFFASAA
jgi:hypothetical protein